MAPEAAPSVPQQTVARLVVTFWRYGPRVRRTPWGAAFAGGAPIGPATDRTTRQTIRATRIGFLQLTRFGQEPIRGGPSLSTLSYLGYEGPGERRAQCQQRHATQNQA